MFELLGIKIKSLLLIDIGKTKKLLGEELRFYRLSLVFLAIFNFVFVIIVSFLFSSVIELLIYYVITNVVTIFFVSYRNDYSNKQKTEEITKNNGLNSVVNGNISLEIDNLYVSQLKLKILLAEDNEVNSMYLKKVLEGAQHVVTLVNDGNKVLEAMEKDDFDLIFMDIQMPIMDGYSTAVAIREKEINSNKHIPIVALTAQRSDIDKGKSIINGMDYYLIKPISISNLIEFIDSIFKYRDLNLVNQQELKNNSNVVNPIDLYDLHESDMLIDLNKIIGKSNNDVNFLKKMTETFSKSSLHILTQIHQAIIEGNSKKLINLAHSLKGNLSFLNAKIACDYARKLENMGKNGVFTDAENVCFRLQKEITLITSILNKKIYEIEDDIKNLKE